MAPAKIQSKAGAAFILNKRGELGMKLQFGQMLRQLRRERDLTQEELAEILNVSAQSVSRWENNTCYPDMELMPVIASFFETTV